MKVRVAFTVEIDEDAWVETYGVDKSEVRDDVKAYVEHGTLAQFDGLELLKVDDHE